jgi:hypothetical protein
MITEFQPPASKIFPKFVVTFGINCDAQLLVEPVAGMLEMAL